jgi:hypothetical protein
MKAASSVLSAAPSAPPIDWTTLSNVWRYSCMMMGIPEPLGERVFRQVVVHDPPKVGDYELAHEVIDWWPAHQVEQRQQLLEQRGVGGAYWQTLAGTLRTARLLWDARQDRDLSMAIWFAAFLHDTTRDRLPEPWRGPVNRMLNAIADLIYEKYGEQHLLGAWHWKSEALPISMLREDLGESIVPKDYRAIVQLVVAQAALSCSAGTLVHVVRGTRTPIQVVSGEDPLAPRRTPN